MQIKANEGTDQGKKSKFTGVLFYYRVYSISDCVVFILRNGLSYIASLIAAFYSILLQHLCVYAALLFARVCHKSIVSLLCSLSSPLLSPSLSLSLPAVLLSLLSASAQTAQMKQVVGVNATLPCHHQYWQSSDSLDIEWILHKPNSKHRVVRDNLSSSSVLLLLSLSFPLCLSLSLSDVSFPYAFFCQSSHLSHSLLPPCLSY